MMIKKDNTKILLGIILMLLSATCVCVGQILWKLSGEHQVLWICLGFVVYAIGALIMIYAYKFGEVSVLQPILCISYPISLCIGALLFNEEITIHKILGVIMIIIGVIAICLGGIKNIEGEK